MAGSGTQTEVATWHWLQRQQAILRQMVIDGRSSEDPKTATTVLAQLLADGKSPEVRIITPAMTRRWSWRVFVRSRAADVVALCIFVAMLAGALSYVILRMDGVIR